MISHRTPVLSHRTPILPRYYKGLGVGKTAGVGEGYVEHQMRGLLGRDYGKDYGKGYWKDYGKEYRKCHHSGRERAEGRGDSAHNNMSGSREHELGVREHVREHGEGDRDGSDSGGSDSGGSDQRGSEYSGGLLERYRVAMDLELADVMGRIEKYEVPWK
jgi:hypothetical protein